jgi:hypothetical protein
MIASASGKPMASAPATVKSNAGPVAARSTVDT